MIEAGQRGATTIADRAVRRIAEHAAQEALQERKVEVTHAAATVEGRRAKVSLGVSLPYPAAWEELGSQVQAHVCERTAELTGLTVPRARIRIGALASESRTAAPGPPSEAARVTLAKTPSHKSQPHGPPPGERPPSPRTQLTGRTRRGAGRFWSGRRTPAALLALVVFLGCAALLVDVVSVHLAGRAPVGWRTELVDWLAGHGPGETVVAAGGGAVAVVGLWLLVLGFTPGRRGLLTAIPVDASTRVAVTRAAVALRVRDAVCDVPGIGQARVTSGRRRIRVRTRLSFGEREAARRAVRGAADEALLGCALARPPRLRVSVRPEAHWRPADDDGQGGDEEQGTPHGAGRPATRPGAAPVEPEAGRPVENEGSEGGEGRDPDA